MRGPSLRKYTRQLWSRMACNSLPDPIPNLLIRCVFFLSPSPSFALTFQQNSLKWELAVPLKIHLKANMSSISFCGRMICAVENAVFYRLSQRNSLCIPHSLCCWQPLRFLITAAQLSLCRTEPRDKWEWPSWQIEYHHLGVTAFRLVWGEGKRHGEGFHLFV